jgi:hypothetical protein
MENAVLEALQNKLLIYQHFLAGTMGENPNTIM